MQLLRCVLGSSWLGSGKPEGQRRLDTSHLNTRLTRLLGCRTVLVSTQNSSPRASRTIVRQRCCELAASNPSTVNISQRPFFRIAWLFSPAATNGSCQLLFN